MICAVRAHVEGGRIEKGQAPCWGCRYMLRSVPWVIYWGLPRAGHCARCAEAMVCALQRTTQTKNIITILN